MNENTRNDIAKVIGVYSMIILVVGTVGNICAAFVCFKKSLREIPTFVFTGFQLISDTISLYFWNIDHYLLAFHSYQIEDVNIQLCKFATFFQTTSLQWSAWLLV